MGAQEASLGLAFESPSLWDSVRADTGLDLGPAPWANYSYSNFSTLNYVRLRLIEILGRFELSLVTRSALSVALLSDGRISIKQRTVLFGIGVM